MKKHLVLLASLAIIGLTGCGSNQQQSNTSSSITGSSSSTPSSSSTSQEIPTTQYYISKLNTIYENGVNLSLESNYDVATRTYEESISYLVGQYNMTESYVYKYNEKNLCTYVKETVDESYREKYAEYNSDDLITKVDLYYKGTLKSTTTFEYDNLKRITKISEPEYNKSYTYTYFDNYTLEIYKYREFTSTTKIVETINELAGRKTISYYKIEGSTEVLDYNIVYDLKTNYIVGMTSTSDVNGFITLKENGDPIRAEWDGSSSTIFKAVGDFYYKADGTLDYILSSQYDQSMNEIVNTKIYITHDANGNVIEEKSYELIDDVETLYSTTTYEIKELDGNTFFPNELTKAIRKGNYINANQGLYYPTQYLENGFNPLQLD